MNLDLSFLPSALRGAEIPRPPSGTLSGHAAGEPFSKLVLGLVRSAFPTQTYLQYEYLNQLYRAHPEATSVELRKQLIPNQAISHLLGRGQAVTGAWTPETPFSEKQNDTADLLVAQAGHLNILDVKTRNHQLQGQPPNIISAYKLAKACRDILASGQDPALSLVYIGLTWEPEETVLRCTQTHIAEMFKVHPQQLYINWAATLQIQFHVENLDQSYPGTTLDWCQDFLHAYADKAAAREIAFRTKFIAPFASFSTAVLAPC